MISRSIKKFGNSRCLPLDKTLLELIGIDINYENAKVNIMIENNKLIIEKSSDVEDQTQFLLNEEEWNLFNKALESKPKKLNNLNKLLTEPGVFDD